MLYKRIFSASFLLLVFPTYLMASMPRISEEKIEKIDVFVKQSVQEVGVPGLAVALIDNGKVVYNYNFGDSTSDGSLVTSKTIFNVGSLTKSFVALAITELESEKLIELDDAVVEHIPWFHTKNKSVSDKITIRQLLTHQSGFSTSQGHNTFLDDANDPSTLENAVREFQKIALAFKPGTQHQYSNSNYQVLSLLIELKTGKSFESFVQDTILLPLNMTASSLITPSSNGALAVPFRSWFGLMLPHKTQIFGHSNSAQGGLYTNIEDLSRYILAMINKEHRLVRDEIITKLFNPEVNTGVYGDASYGLGWYIHEHDDYREIWHSGASPGYEAIAGFSPEAKIGYVVLVNASRGTIANDIGHVVESIRHLVFDRSPQPVYISNENRMGFLILSIVTLAIFLWNLSLLSRCIKISKTYPVSKAKSQLIFKRSALLALTLALLPFICIILVPKAFNTNFGTIWAFAPDFAWLLLAFSVVTFSSAVLLVWTIFISLVRQRDS